MTRIRAIIIAAQDEEIRPVLEGLAERATKPVRIACPVACAWITAHTKGNILVMTTGIGTTATAVALSWALTKYKPKVVVSTGSAGGVGADISVGDVVVGTEYAYTFADATAFGYAPGQIPGQPSRFRGAVDLIESACPQARKGLMLSADSFVTADNIGETRATFPDALTTDMESTAAAQVCHAWGVPFVSVRCVSDLCGPRAQDDYSMSLDLAARRAAGSVIALLLRVADKANIGPSQRFSEEALTAALLYILAKVKQLPPGDAARVPTDLVAQIPDSLPSHHKDKFDLITQYIGAALDAIDADPTLTLTAKQYDDERVRLAERYQVDTGRGQLLWPPTSQTIIKRFNGYWNDALSHVGFRVQTGRKRGGLKFSDQDYLNALRNFATWASRQSISPSYKAYQTWVKECGDAKVPSGAAIRQRFGSWRTATQQANI